MGTQLYFGDQPVGGAGGESVPGPPGDSAYEVAVNNGFDGSEAEWLDSLQGEPGEKGADSIDALRRAERRRVHVRRLHT